MTDITIEHVRLSTSRPFGEVIDRLEANLPELDFELVRMLETGDRAGVERARAEGPPLWLFEKQDHGAILAGEGSAARAIQFVIGNPLTAVRITRHVLAAGLYAPLRVIVYEQDGETVIEYDRPSTLFGQFGVDAVTEVGRELDRHLSATLQRATQTATAEG